MTIVVAALAVCMPKGRPQLSAQSPAASPATTAAPAQDSIPTIKVSVRYIEVDAVVTDGKGRFVTDLTKDDFLITEDGVPQTIEKVTLVDLPPRRQSTVHASSFADITTSAVAQTEYERAGRIYVMVLDSSQEYLERTRALARQFIKEYLGDTDMMAIVTAHERDIATSNTRLQTLTSDKVRLLAAVDRFTGGYTDVNSYKLLKDVAVNLGAVTGRRRSVLYFGEGQNLWARRDDIHDIWAVFNDAMRTAAAFNVPIHTISPLGLKGVPVSGEFEIPTGGLIGTPVGRDRDSAMRLISEDTGGIALVNTNNLSRGLTRIIERDSHYYVIGYYSSLEHDGKYHPLAVRTTRPDVRIDARDGIRMLKVSKGKSVGMPKTTSAPARSALKAKNAAGKIPLDIAATVFRGEDYAGSVLVETSVSGRDLNLTEGQKVEISVAAIDASGRIRGTSNHRFSLSLKPGTRERVERNGVESFSRLTLPTGSYDIRVVVNQPGGETGVESLAVNVPDFTERSIFFSDILVSAPQAPPLALVVDKVLRRALQNQPTRARRFPANHEIEILAEIYDAHWLLTPEVLVKWSLSDERDRVIVHGESRMPSVLGGKMQFKGRVPLTNVAAGSYLLTVEASTTGGPPANAQAQLTFDVVAD